MRVIVLFFSRTTLFIVLICFFCSGCPLEGDPPFDSEIIIKNESDEDILVGFDFKYPDTTLIASNQFEVQFSYPNSLIPSKEFQIYPDHWISSFNRMPDKKIMVFLFSKDTIDVVPWETIRTEYKVLKRYDLGLEELQTNDWMIIYE